MTMTLFDWWFWALVVAVVGFYAGVRYGRRVRRTRSIVVDVKMRPTSNAQALERLSSGHPDRSNPAVVASVLAKDGRRLDS